MGGEGHQTSSCWAYMFRTGLWDMLQLLMVNQATIYTYITLESVAGGGGWRFRICTTDNITDSLELLVLGGHGGTT